VRLPDRDRRVLRLQQVQLAEGFAAAADHRRLVTRRQNLAIVFAALASACAGEPDWDRHDLDGLTVLERFDEQICGGTFAYLSERLDLLEQATGLPRDPRGLIFYWYVPDAPPEVCGEGVIGCASGREFWSGLIRYSHELAHVHLGRLGQPRPWLSEGMAVMLEDWLAGPSSQTPTEMMKATKSSEVDYWSAGNFTRYLRDRYSMATLLHYFEATHGASVERSIAAFREVFGDDFAAVEADYLALADPLHAGLLSCDQTEIAWDGGTWRYATELSCDDADAIGPSQGFADPELPTTFRETVTLTASAGWHSFRVESAEFAQIYVMRCDQPEVVLLYNDEPAVVAHLDGGRYLVEMHTFTGFSLEIEVVIERLEHAPAGGIDRARPDRPMPRRSCSMSELVFEEGQ
jgi:hypothetical protein